MIPSEKTKLESQYAAYMNEKLSYMLKKITVPEWLNQQLRRLAQVLGLTARYGDSQNFLYKLSKLYKRLKYAETTEDDFHRLLDANPNDHQTRMVFADWLQEKDDPRAAGYRALGKQARQPWPVSPVLTEHSPAWTHTGNMFHGKDPIALPLDWFKHIEGHHNTKAGDANIWRRFNSRRESEDAAAHAFTKLPKDRQEELLNG